MSRVVAIVQARMGSSRLPGKVLMDIHGKPMLQRVLERVSRATKVDEVVVATSTDPDDKAILTMAERLGFRAVAGSEDDVLDRYDLAARKASADVVVRITADCPATDPELIDRTLGFYFAEGADYAANCIQQTFPRGLEIEVFSADRLHEIAKSASIPFEREHVTPHFYLNPDEYTLRFLAAEGELRRPELRVCVDTEQDYALLQEIYGKLGQDFSVRDLVDLFNREPQLRTINAAIRQKKLGE